MGAIHKLKVNPGNLFQLLTGVGKKNKKPSVNGLHTLLLVQYLWPWHCDIEVVPQIATLI